MPHVNAIAISWVYNEADIVGWCIDHLLEQGVDVMILDNWSDDGSYELVDRYTKTHPTQVYLARWPSAPPETTSWWDMLKVSEETALAFHGSYDWIIHQDADEFSYSTHPGERLIDAIQRIDDAGYTAIDHEMHIYKPVPVYDGSLDPRTTFTELYENHETKIAEQLRELKIFRQPPTRVDLAHNGGHTVRFLGCNVAPERFIKRHYPLRSPEHAARKIASRKSRWSASDFARRWHVHYDDPRHFPV